MQSKPECDRIPSNRSNINQVNGLTGTRNMQYTTLTFILFGDLSKNLQTRGQRGRHKLKIKDPGRYSINVHLRTRGVRDHGDTVATTPAGRKRVSSTSIGGILFGQEKTPSHITIV